MTVSSLHYTAFFKEIHKRNSVWTIKEEDQYVTPKGQNGNRSMPFWSSNKRVSLIISSVPTYNDCIPFEISLDDFVKIWLPLLEKDNLNVGINWSGEKAIGYDVKPKDVLARIEDLSFQKSS